MPYVIFPFNYNRTLFKSRWKVYGSLSFFRSIVQAVMIQILMKFFILAFARNITLSTGNNKSGGCVRSYRWRHLSSCK